MKNLRALQHVKCANSGLLHLQNFDYVHKPVTDREAVMNNFTVFSGMNQLNKLCLVENVHKDERLNLKQIILQELNVIRIVDELEPNQLYYCIAVGSASINFLRYVKDGKIAISNGLAIGLKIKQWELLNTMYYKTTPNNTTKKNYSKTMLQPDEIQFLMNTFPDVDVTAAAAARGGVSIHCPMHTDRNKSAILYPKTGFIRCLSSNCAKTYYRFKVWSHQMKQ